MILLDEMKSPMKIALTNIRSADYVHNSLGQSSKFHTAAQFEGPPATHRRRLYDRYPVDALTSDQRSYLKHSRLLRFWAPPFSS